MADDGMKKPRRSRADSKESAVKNMMAASRQITPPASIKMSKEQLAIFHEIIDELPRGEWTAHMIRLAAIMARDMHTLCREQEALDREGNVAIAANGSPIRNPRLSAVNALTTSILATRRSLSLHSRAKAGMDNRVLARRREIQRENEVEAPEDDDLIKRPTLN